MVIPVNPPEETSTLVKIDPKKDALVMAYYSQAGTLLEYAKSRNIATIEDANAATNDLAMIANLRKALDKRRKDYLAPFQEHVKEVNGIYQTFMASVEEADRITRVKWQAFMNEQARLKAKQEEINNLRIEATRKEAELSGTGEIKEETVLIPVIEAPKKTKTEMGTAGQKANWVYQITDFALLPDAYKLPNTAALNALARSVKDSRAIPGLRIYNEPTVAVRTK